VKIEQIEGVNSDLILSRNFLRKSWSEIQVNRRESGAPLIYGKLWKNSWNTLGINSVSDLPSTKDFSNLIIRLGTKRFELSDNFLTCQLAIRNFLPDLTFHDKYSGSFAFPFFKFPSAKKDLFPGFRFWKKMDLFLFDSQIVFNHFFHQKRSPEKNWLLDSHVLFEAGINEIQIGNIFSKRMESWACRKSFFPFYIRVGCVYSKIFKGMKVRDSWWALEGIVGVRSELMVMVWFFESLFSPKKKKFI